MIELEEAAKKREKEKIRTRELFVFKGKQDRKTKAQEEKS